MRHLHLQKQKNKKQKQKLTNKQTYFLNITDIYHVCNMCKFSTLGFQ